MAGAEGAGGRCAWVLSREVPELDCAAVTIKEAAGLTGPGAGPKMGPGPGLGTGPGSGPEPDTGPKRADRSVPPYSLASPKGALKEPEPGELESEPRDG